MCPHHQAHLPFDHLDTVDQHTKMRIHVIFTALSSLYGHGRFFKKNQSKSQSASRLQLQTRHNTLEQTKAHQIRTTSDSTQNSRTLSQAQQTNQTGRERIGRKSLVGQCCCHWQNLFPLSGEQPPTGGHEALAKCFRRLSRCLPSRLAWLVHSGYLFSPPLHSTVPPKVPHQRGGLTTTHTHNHFARRLWAPAHTRTLSIDTHNPFFSCSRSILQKSDSQILLTAPKQKWTPSRVSVASDATPDRIDVHVSSRWPVIDMRPALLVPTAHSQPSARSSTFNSLESAN